MSARDIIASEIPFWCENTEDEADSILRALADAGYVVVLRTDIDAIASAGDR